MAATKKEKGREYIQIDQKDMLTLKELLQIKSNKCHYCGDKIKDDDKFSIYNLPTRLVCNSPLCVTQALMEDEKED